MPSMNDFPELTPDRGLYAIELYHAMRGYGTLHDVVTTASNDTEIVLGTVYIDKGAEIGLDCVATFDMAAAELLGKAVFRAVPQADLKRRLEKTQLGRTASTDISFN